jgi:hypothetical protein
VTENANRPVAAVTRPEPPENQVRALGFRKQRQPIDSAVLANPIARSDMVDPVVAGVSEGSCLLRREVAALRLGEVVEFLLPFAGRRGGALKGQLSGPIMRLRAVRSKRLRSRDE